MLRRLLFTIIAVVACAAGNAQSTCVINGTMENDRLDNGKKIKTVTLVRANEFGQDVEVAVSKVKKGKYSFKYELVKDEPVMMYRINGFGEGKEIELFVEPGEVNISTQSVSNICGSIVAGTPANDTYSEFKAVMNSGYKECETQIEAFVAENGKEWLETAEGKSAVKRIESKEAITTLSRAVRFIIDHNGSPVAPFVIERYMLHLLTPAYADQMLKSVAKSLQKHPYTLSLRNKVLANNLKVGNEVPDIMLPLSNGEQKMLADFRGRYVVLNFWTSNEAKSDAMLEVLRNLYGIVKDNKEQLVIVSYSLDSDKTVWKDAVESLGIDVDGWLHACDGLCLDSPAAKLLGVDKTPRIVLVEPEGRAVSLDMDMDEVVMRVEQILSGDLYYLDKED